jgi:hypothetical protein
MTRGRGGRSVLPCFEPCAAQGWVSWEEDNDSIAGPWDHDVVECLTVLRLPVFPCRAFHTYDWSKEVHLEHFGPHLSLAVDASFQMIPLRLSGILIAKCFLRRWLYVLGGGGLLAVFTGSRATDLYWQTALYSLGIALSLFSLTCAIWLKAAESRIRKIRRLLGRHQRGSSDPATWADGDSERIPEAQKAFGFSCYEDAVEAMLEKRDYSAAMWAARMSVVREGQLRGKQLTTRVLRHPDVKQCLAGSEDHPKAWLEALRAIGAENDCLTGYGVTRQQPHGQTDQNASY